MALAALDDVDLAWDERAAVATLQIERSDVEPATVRFTVEGGRVRVGLVLLGGRREIDVSIQPALVARMVGGRGSPSAAHVGTWLAAFAGAHGAWRPEDPVHAGLVAVVAGSTFPLLGAALEAGAAPLDEVPRWAAPALAAPTAREGARVAFARRATRPVVAAFAASLVSGRTDPAPGGGDEAPPVALFPLALALMAPAVAPDRLARLLGATEPTHPPAQWPDVDLVADAARLTPHLGEHRTERLLLDAARVDGGPALLAEAVQAYGVVRHRAGRRLPNRLVEFRDHCRALLPPDPNPLGIPAPVRRRAPARAPVAGRASTPPATPPPACSAPPAPPAPTAAERRRAMFHAPRTQGRGVPAHVPLVHQPAVTALSGREVDVRGADPLRLVVPRTAAELSEWGERLHNCVGGFGAAVNEGRSVVVGVESGARLTYCIELRPDGVVRQFLGTHNRPVPRPDALAVLHALAAAGVVRRDVAANDHWFEPV